MSADAVKTRVIAKPRLIAALLAEIDAAGAVVMVASGSGDSARAVSIACDIRVPFDTTRVKIMTPGVVGGNLDCTALFAGQRLHFSLACDGAALECPLPAEVVITDLRSSKRRKFGVGVEAAEISTRHGVVMAVPIDMSLNSLALIAVSPATALLPGDPVVVRIRGEAGAPDVFNGEMQIQAVHKLEGQTRLLVQGRPLSVDSVRQVSRIAGVNGTMEIGPLDLSLGGAVVLRLQNVSMTGLCGILEASDGGAWLVPGMQVKLGVGDLTGTLVWARTLGVGIKLNGLDDPDILRRWVRFLAQLRSDNGVLRSEMAEFAGLLTQAGFLKGSRRKVFGKSVSRFLPPEVITANSMIYLRYAARDDQGELTGHVSMVRLTDEAWIQQEGVLTESATHSLGAMSDALTARARDLKYASSTAPRYVVWLWDSAVKPSEALMQTFATQSVNRRFAACHIGVTAQGVASRESGDCRLIDLSYQTAHERFEIRRRFDPALVEVFAGGDGLHPRLNSELARLGHGHVARTVALGDQTGVWGLAYRLSSYYALNATGMLNTIFLIVRNDVTGPQVHDGLARLVSERFSFGADDVAIIFDQPLPAESTLMSSLVKPKPYNFMVVDVLLNKIHVTLDDPSMAEKRGVR